MKDQKDQGSKEKANYRRSLEAKWNSMQLVSSHQGNCFRRNYNTQTIAQARFVSQIANTSYNVGKSVPTSSLMLSNQVDDPSS